MFRFLNSKCPCASARVNPASTESLIRTAVTRLYWSDVWETVSCTFPEMLMVCPDTDNEHRQSNTRIILRINLVKRQRYNSLLIKRYGDAYIELIYRRIIFGDG